jgi:hypothetical protein
MKRASTIARNIAYVYLALCALFFGCHMVVSGGLPYFYFDIERLRNPERVAEIRGNSLVLENGQTVPLPHVIELHADTPVLREAISRGVEIGNDGRVYGSVRMAITCGNDGCILRIRRFDLSYLVAAAEEGSTDLATDGLLALDGKFSMTGYTLPIVQIRYRMIQRRATETGQATAGL